ncbi:DNA internalization-related competence protein ComEC/Rec2 [Shewanella colwelliana]|uniref:DNA internalization-related competence protein ComEC/Rec2 n=1 Tax=Shewanella colwelliana TaxID=23 RepID=UPI00299E0640|nr:DNA internalization-related competence protein ComEC/Rec2 [Shewanella colwelliana]MDX1282022.1 DNA internalization-related competence protein ComEC/Rec2 [Shewanella colwelliana]
MFGYCASIISALIWPSLLSPQLAWCSLFAAFLLLRWSRILAGSLLALAWMSLFCHQMLAFPEVTDGQSIQVRGEIISLVQRNSDWISVDIRLLNDNLFDFPQRFMRLEWLTEQNPTLGSQWLLRVKPRSISSHLNQGGFNRQRYFLSKHIIGRGKVVAATAIEATPNPRFQLISQLIPQVENLNNGDLILALMFGDKQLISTEHWQGLRQSGTGHLISISGLHLSVLALWLLLCIGGGLKRMRPRYGLSNTYLTALATIMVTAIYGYLSGFSLPTLRAFSMLCLVIVVGVLQRHSSPFERLLYALFIVLLLDPLSVLSSGLWLSFGALAVILWFGGQLANAVKVEEQQQPDWLTIFWRRLVILWSIQWRLSLLMGAMLLLLFGGVSPYSVWFNLLFVPWFSVLVIPFTFIALMWWGASVYLQLPADLPLVILDWLIAPLTYSFNGLQYLPGSWLNVSSQLASALLFGLVAFGVYRLPIALRWKGVASVLCAPLLWLMISPMLVRDEEGWRVHLLDVGQGLSVVIERRDHILLYDTGAAFGESFSYAKQVVIPFMHSKGFSRVDYLVVSHGDNDHAGGTDVLIAQYPQAQIITDLAPYDGLDCRPKTLTWHELTINVLGPQRAENGNNGSCVLQITDGLQQIMLPGDIEIEAEIDLISQQTPLSPGLSSRVLVAPHHGSNTSSSQGFVDAVAPEIVLYAAGLNNRYGFPKNAVIKRYDHIDASQYSVGTNGQISLFFEQDGIKVVSYRRDIAPFWYNQVFEFGEFANTE